LIDFGDINCMICVSAGPDLVLVNNSPFYLLTSLLIVFRLAQVWFYHPETWLQNETHWFLGEFISNCSLSFVFLSPLRLLWVF